MWALYHKGEAKINFLKQNNGVTLIALAVSVVIMIILASITINLTIGDQGITQKAKNEKNNTRIKMIQDAKTTYYLEKDLGQTNDSLLDYLINRGVITEEERTEIENNDNKLVIGNTTISFAKRLVDAFKDGELQVGDWVNYKNPTSVSVTGEGYTSAGYISPASRTGMTAENLPDVLTEDLA